MRNVIKFINKRFNKNRNLERPAEEQMEPIEITTPNHEERIEQTINTRPEITIPTNYDDLVEALDRTVNVSAKQTIIITFLENHSNKINLDQFIEVLNKFANEDKIKIFSKFIKEYPNAITYDNFIKVLEQSGDDFYKDEITFKFIENSNNKITGEQFIEILKQSSSDHYKNILVSKFLENPNNKITGEQFIEVLKQFSIDAYKNRIASEFLENPNNKITVEEFIKVLEKIDEKSILDLAHIFLSNPSKEISAKQLAGVIRQFKDESARLEIIKAYLANYKTSATEAVQSITPSEKKIEFLSQIITVVGILYDIDKVFALLINCFDKPISATKQTAKQISNFANRLYPSAPALRIQLFEAAITHKNITKENIKNLDLTSIENDDLFSFIEFAQRRLGLQENDVFNLIKGRACSRYSFLVELTTSKDLSECFTEDGVESIKNLFGANSDPSQINIASIFSYFDLIDNIDGLRAILKPDFLLNIKQNFHPSENVLFVSNEEMLKISKLFNISQTEMEEAHFLKAEIFCNHFAALFKALPELSENYIREYKINFDDEPIDKPRSEEYKEKLNSEFRELLLSNEVNPHMVSIENKEKIKAFFKLSGLEVESISNANWNNITETFYQSKNKLAYLFKQPQGLFNFITSIYSAADGCAANIGSQISILTYQSLCTNPSDALMFEVMEDKIIRPMINVKNGKNDIIGSFINPLEITKVRTCIISPDVLLKETAEFFKDKNGQLSSSRNPWKFIEHNLKEKHPPKEAKQIYEKIIEELTCDLLDFDFDCDELKEETTKANNKAAQIAALIAIEDVVGNKLPETSKIVELKREVDSWKAEAIENSKIVVDEIIEDQKTALKRNLVKSLTDPCKSISRSRVRRVKSLDAINEMEIL